MKSDGARRVAVVGAGPAGLYTAEHLLEAVDLDIAVDLFDRLPSPWGLVRYGVAPDHPEKKQVIEKLFRFIFDDDRVRFFGAVSIGQDITHEELCEHYDAVVYAVGGSGDNTLDVPGTDLGGVHTSREFTGWINGHPDHSELDVNLDCRRAVVIGNGNVALDVARMLVRPVSELAATDVSDQALEILRQSKIKEVVVLGRRARLHAAFHNPELEELEHLSDVDIRVSSGEDAFETSNDATNFALQRKIATLSRLGSRPTCANRRLVLRFLATPMRIEGDSSVSHVVVGANKTQRNESGELLVQSIGESERLDCGVVVVAIGHRVMPIQGLPFDSTTQTFRSEDGRACTDDGPLPFTYVTGWARRGCRGLIGTNRKCAGEVVRSLLGDLTVDTREPHASDAAAMPKFLGARGVSFVSREGWDKVDLAEKLGGRQQGRPRVKFTNASDVYRIAYKNQAGAAP